MATSSIAEQLFNHAKTGSLTDIKRLVYSGTDITVEHNKAVRLACQYGHADIVKFLVEETGQNVDLSNDGGAAYHVAVVNGHLNVVKYFIEYWSANFDQLAADSNTVDLWKYHLYPMESRSYWDTFLLFPAAFHNHPQIFQLLFEHMFSTSTIISENINESNSIPTQELDPSDISNDEQEFFNFLFEYIIKLDAAGIIEGSEKFILNSLYTLAKLNLTDLFNLIKEKLVAEKLWFSQLVKFCPLVLDPKIAELMALSIFDLINATPTKIRRKLVKECLVCAHKTGYISSPSINDRILKVKPTFGFLISCIEYASISRNLDLLKKSVARLQPSMISTSLNTKKKTICSIHLRSISNVFLDGLRFLLEESKFASHLEVVFVKMDAAILFSDDRRDCHSACNNDPQSKVISVEN